MGLNAIKVMKSCRVPPSWEPRQISSPPLNRPVCTYLVHLNYDEIAFIAAWFQALLFVDTAGKDVDGLSNTHCENGTGNSILSM